MFHLIITQSLMSLCYKRTSMGRKKSKIVLNPHLLVKILKTDQTLLNYFCFQFLEHNGIIHVTSLQLRQCSCTAVKATVA